MLVLTAIFLGHIFHLFIYRWFSFFFFFIRSSASDTTDIQSSVRYEFSMNGKFFDIFVVSIVDAGRNFFLET